MYLDKTKNNNAKILFSQREYKVQQQVYTAFTEMASIEEAQRFDRQIDKETDRQTDSKTQTDRQRDNEADGRSDENLKLTF